MRFSVVVALAGLAVLCSLQAAHAQDHLTPSCMFESSREFGPTSAADTLHGLLDAYRFKSNLFVVSCLAFDTRVAPNQPASCTKASTVSPVIKAGAFLLPPNSKYGTEGFTIPMGNLFVASVLMAVYEVPSDYATFNKWGIDFDQVHDPSIPPSCRSTFRVGDSLGLGSTVNTGVDIANLVEVSPSIIHTGRNSLFTFERTLSWQSATNNFYDQVVLVRDHKSCSVDGPGKLPLYNPVRYLRGANGKLRFDWVVNIQNSGFYRLCAKFQGSPTFLDVAFIRAFGGNPLYMRAHNVNRGNATGTAVDVTFFGTDLSTTADCAKAVKVSEPCTTERTDVGGGSLPSCAGGSPLRVGAGAGGWSATQGLEMLSWSVVITEVGSYRICYRTAGVWEDVINYDELTNHTKNWFINNATNGTGTDVVPDGPRPHFRNTFTLSRSHSLNEESAVTAAPVPTVGPDQILCNFTHPGNGTTAYFACSANDTCGETMPACVAPAVTETAIPTAPPPTVPAGHLNCTSSNGTTYFCPANTTTCSTNGITACFVINAPTATSVPVTTMFLTTPPPSTLSPDLQLCTWFNATSNANETFTCSVNATCGAGGCVVIATSTGTAYTLPPTTIPPHLQLCTVAFNNGTSGTFFCFAGNETCGAAFGVCELTVTAMPVTEVPTTTVPVGYQACTMNATTAVRWLCHENATCGAFEGECVISTDAAITTTTTTTAPTTTTTAIPPGMLRCGGVNGSLVFYCNASTERCGQVSDTCVLVANPAATEIGTTNPPTTTPAPTTTAHPPTLPAYLQPCEWNGTAFACWRSNETCGRGFCAAVTAAPVSTLAPVPTSPPGYIDCGFGFCPPNTTCGNSTCLIIATATSPPTPPPPTLPANVQACTYLGQSFYCLLTEACGDGACITATATAAATTGAPTTTVPPITAPPGMQVCHASADGSVVFFCPTTQVCGSAGQCVVVQTQTAAPTPPPASVIPPGYKVCAGGFLCNLTFTCDNTARVCIQPTINTNTAAPLPAPVTADPNATQCLAPSNGAVLFECPAVAPVCCIALNGCCQTGYVCGATTCVAITPMPTPAPPTPVPPTTPPPATAPPPQPTPPPTTTATPCPTAPASWPGFSASVEPVLTVALESSVLPSDFLQRLGELICVPESAMSIEGVAGASVTLRIDCEPTECNNVMRMNYALFLFSTDTTQFAQAGIRGIAKRDSDTDSSNGGTSTIHVHNAASDDDGDDESANKTRWLIIVAATVVVLALIIAVVVVVKRRRRGGAAGGRRNMRFDLDHDVAHDDEMAEAARRRADMDMRGAGADVDEFNDPMDLADANASIASDTPLDIDDVDIVVDIVPEKPGSY